MCPRSPGRLTPGTCRQLACGIHSLDCRSRLSIKPVYVGVLFSLSEQRMLSSKPSLEELIGEEKLQAN